eukprot:CAMPEP_0180041076 /NCGR_PEP_ID=MMETSP0984-20121128/33877_1 /TAXON_ID=483367 /ORGANISM="non described non described, Strain CCMP 2436" /LENGTH=62 /DNA_ID=CAMNT_0021968513 /DNA_START=490 /DNA_END=674 /DNA_ORIENTATION=-
MTTSSSEASTPRFAVLTSFSTVCDPERASVRVHFVELDAKLEAQFLELILGVAPAKLREEQV